MPYLRPTTGNPATIGFPIPIVLSTRVTFHRGQGYVVDPEGRTRRFAIPVVVYGAEEELKVWHFSQGIFLELRDLMRADGSIPDVQLSRTDERFHPWHVERPYPGNDQWRMLDQGRMVYILEHQPWVVRARTLMRALPMWSGFTDEMRASGLAAADHHIDLMYRRGQPPTNHITTSIISEISTHQSVEGITRIQLLLEG